LLRAHLQERLEHALAQHSHDGKVGPQQRVDVVGGKQAQPRQPRRQLRPLAAVPLAAAAGGGGGCSRLTGSDSHARGSSRCCCRRLQVVLQVALRLLVPPLLLLPDLHAHRALKQPAR
jgi:hypothetical protein